MEKIGKFIRLVDKKEAKKFLKRSPQEEKKLEDIIKKVRTSKGIIIITIDDNGISDYMSIKCCYHQLMKLLSSLARMTAKLWSSIDDVAKDIEDLIEKDGGSLQQLLEKHKPTDEPFGGVH